MNHVRAQDGQEGERRKGGVNEWHVDREKVERSDGEVRGGKDYRREWEGSIELDKGNGKSSRNMPGWIRLSLFVNTSLRNGCSS